MSTIMAPAMAPRDQPASQVQVAPTRLMPTRLMPMHVAVAGVLMLCAWVLARLVLASPTMGQDQAWLLYAATRVLHGVPLYGSQLTETNPPLIIWFSIPAVWIAAALHIQLTTAFYVLTALVTVASAGWCALLLRRSELPPLSAVFAGLAVLGVELLVPLDSSGQREHLFLLFAMPCIVALSLRWRAPVAGVEAAALGVAAAFGVCLKPQQGLTLAALVVTAFVLRRAWQRSTDAANVVAVAALLTGAAYVGAVLLFAPLYIRAAMPVLLHTYWAFGTFTPLQSLRMDRHFLGLFVVAAGLCALRSRFHLSRVPAVLLLLSAAAAVAYAMQRTGFTYQHMPADLLAELSVMWSVAEIAGAALTQRASWIQRAILPAQRAFIALAVLAVVLAVDLAHVRHEVRAEGRASNALRDFYATLPAGTAVYALSTTPRAGFPYVLEDHLTWVSRYVHLWLLPAVEQNELYLHGGPRPAKLLPPAVMARVAAQQRDDVADDLTSRRPAYVLVEHCYEPFTCEAVRESDFNVLGWMQRSPRFHDAWQPYTLTQTLSGTDARAAWDVYTRR